MLWLLLGDALFLAVFVFVDIDPTRLVAAALLIIPALTAADLLYRIASSMSEDEE